MTTLALAQISLTSANADTLASFYEAGLGFVRTGRSRVDATLYGMPGTGALVVTLALGEQLIELVQFDQPGAPYPPIHSSYDLAFQHIAIVVTNIAAALQRLQAQATPPIPISLEGPVTLPASSGGVTAIKLRDPELHPFELLQFPAGGIPAYWSGRVPQDGVALGIDHTAIVVSNVAASAAFYTGFGLLVTSNTVNQGPAQVSLDAAAGAVVEVVGLSPLQATPHVELLCYSAPTAAAASSVAANDIAATRLVMHDDGPGMASGLLLDPDGHRLLLVQSRGWEDPDNNVGVVAS